MRIKDEKGIKIVFFIMVVFLVAGIIVFIYLYNNGLSGQHKDTGIKEGQIKIACVGDSITYGHGITNWELNNYPAQLQRILGDTYHVANFGSSGACVNPKGDQPYISREVYQNSLNYGADILVFMLGTNDSKPENWTNRDDYTLTKEHPEWFTKDGIHPNNDGARAIAELVAEAIQ